jgi:hypothetical protein
MALKVSARNKTACLLISLLITLSGSRPCRAETEKTEAVRLETFTVGVFRSARRRYQVKDIKVGDVSVLSLFKEVDRTKPAWWPGGYLWQEEIPLVINGGKELEKLKQVLIAYPDHPLEVVLRDEWNPIWSRIARWNSKDPYEYSISIPVTFERTTCDKVSRVIYEKIISKVIKEENEKPVKKEREADRRLDVNEVFDKLHDDNEIEAYINSLGSVTNNPCVETIRLLNSRTEEKTTGFDSGEYTLHKKIQDGLKLIINAMATEPGWWKSDLSVKVIGFTDEIEVKENIDKELQISETGISTDAWSRIANPFEVYYSGCHGNKVKDKPVYLSFPAGRSEQQVGHRITNNCELGAVRAYVAMVYLTSELGRNSLEDSYATGGIYSGPDANNKKDDPEKRRVHVEFTIKAAKVDKSNL